MTHFQDLFIKNLRFYRTGRDISQIDFSKLINLSPNYLNAVENGKNFPSPEVIQKMSDILEILPYQLFLEHPVNLSGVSADEKMAVIQELSYVKQQLIDEIDDIIQKYKKSQGHKRQFREKS
jgi:transcriptional regulator with XRE-family HTH domain